MDTIEEAAVGHLNHIGIVVPDLDAACALYRDTLGFKVSAPIELSDDGLRMAFVELDNTRVELLMPTVDESPIADFLVGHTVNDYLARNPAGGMHHVCYEVDDLGAATDALRDKGMRVLGDGQPRIGAHGKPILFLDPDDACGTLVELKQR